MFPRFSLFTLLTCTLLTTACGDGGPSEHPDDPSSECGAGLPSENGVCVLAGNLTRDLTLTRDKKWLLRGGVLAGSEGAPITLTIEPGTTIYGEVSTKAFLAVQRGSRIDAAGTKDAPITFTSSKQPGDRARGDWGGIVLNGSATINACQTQPCEADGEGDSGKYGGSDDASSCGRMRYVRIEFAGNQITAENELNGLALQGCGSGTELEYLHVHMASDDGIELFGGTASFKHVLLTGISDDALDWTFGWRGKGQFLVAQQYEDEGDNGIEADNNSRNRSAAPRARPVLSNLTLIGSPQSSASDLGILLREGTGAIIANSVVKGWNEACFDLDNAETFAVASADGTTLTGDLVVKNTIFDCATNFKEDNEQDAMMNPVLDPFDVSMFVMTMNAENSTQDAMLPGAFQLASPGFQPAAGSPLLSNVATMDDAFFEPVSFRGGVDPQSDWTAGWTRFDRN